MAVRLSFLALAFSLLFTPSVGAQITSVNGQIAYVVCDYEPTVGGSACDIWRIDSDGTNAINLTQTPSISETSPVWSPDGTGSPM